MTASRSERMYVASDEILPSKDRIMQYSIRSFTIAIWVCLATLLSAGCSISGENQDKVLRTDAETTIFIAHKIITMDDRRPEAKAVAVRRGKITALGDTAEDVQSQLNETAIVNRSFENDVLMPGFIDPHLHPIMSAVLLPMEFITPEDWDLPRGHYQGVRTPEDYLVRLKTAIAQNEKEDIFFTWGWHHLWHGDITRDILNDIEPNKPVFVWHRSFHEIVTNDAGMAFMGYDTEQDFEAAIHAAGGDQSHANFAKGMISETTLPIALAKLNQILLSEDHLAKGFSELEKMMQLAGVTLIADMATGLFTDFDTEAQIMAKLFEREEMSARILLVPVANLMAGRTGGTDSAMTSLDEKRKNWPYKNMILNRRVKLFADGAFFSQYMMMNPPGYLDGHTGKWLIEPEELDHLSKTFWKEGYSLHTHVNGDHGLDVVLSTLEDIRKMDKHEDQRFVFEHLGYSTEQQNKRIAKLEGIVSAQPNYYYVLSNLYAKQGLGPERAHAISRLGSLERIGVPVTLHSDLTMAPVDPLFLAWISTNRLNMEGQTLRADEQISLDAGLKAITINAALALGLENDVGSIVLGKRADFTVLGDDPYEVGAQGLQAIEIKGTVFGGKVFESK